MIIGVVPDPAGWEHWDEAKAYLEPARAMGGFKAVIEPDEELFAVIDDGELLACATAWMSADTRAVEVKLVGGRDYRRWLAQLDSVIGKAAADAGATRLCAYGRRGWLKELRALGWASMGEVDGSTVYSRELGN